MKRLLVAALVAIVCIALPAPAGSQGPGEVITNYDVEMVIGSDGVVSFTETIDYDFGSSERHGIFRDLVRQERYDSENDRTYDIDVTGVTIDGGSVPVEEGSEGSYLRLRIGDPDSTVTGQHTYMISYEVRGAITPFSEHDELYWDAIGSQWQVPILNATSTVASPAPIDRYLCFSGPQGSTLPCNTATADGDTARFSASGLGLGSGMTVVVAVPKSAITPEPEVLLSERYDIVEAFSVTPVTAPLAVGLAVVAVGGVGLVAWRRGRDRRWTGSAVDAAFGNISGDDERIPVGQHDPGPVEFVPPDGVRPGQVGTLIDERANLLDVTATIVDLAVRGHLKIVEVDVGERHARIRVAPTRRRQRRIARLRTDPPRRAVRVGTHRPPLGPQVRVHRGARHREARALRRCRRPGLVPEFTRRHALGVAGVGRVAHTRRYRPHRRLRGLDQVRARADRSS